ncbi:MAG: carboxypeptidase regulatory-like domain-containing protein [Cyanobacteria bacterium NC_groundwater_1444_Ag_S-0.65um_54_12]|nr:carboxypeptidase regulatory-like domain-containing protein [Cyanobacteria bacterium NC_groundwater_1444_Ag_S-0.65um_54_12]
MMENDKLNSCLSISAKGMFILSAVLAGGCPQVSKPVKLEPTSVPPAFIAVAPGDTQKSPHYLTGGTLNLRVLDAVTHKRVAQAKIAIMGPTLAHGVTGSTYDLVFGPLVAASYSIRAEARGYVTKVESAVAIEKLGTHNSELLLLPGAGQVTGRVVDAATKKPISGAHVYAGASTTFSGTDGSFSLSDLVAGTHILQVSKTGYAAASPYQASTGTDVGTLPLWAEPLTVDIAYSQAVFGNSGTRATLLGLEDALRAAGVKVQENDPKGANIRIFFTPPAEAASEDVTVQRFVAEGGKVVVCGEWGGYAYSVQAANKLLQPMGLAISADLVRSSKNLGQADWILATPRLPIAEPLREIALFDSASVFALPPAWPVLTVNTGYRVAATQQSEIVLGAIAPYGGGMAVALGDSSAWSDVASFDQGPNLLYQDNRSFVVKLILW